MYTEASSPRKPGQKARLISAVFGPVIPPMKCSMTFYYHLFGKSMGSLNVYTRSAVNGKLNQVGKTLSGKWFIQREICFLAVENLIMGLLCG